MAAKRGHELSFEHVTVSVAASKSLCDAANASRELLDNLSGSFPTASLVAIMGASGSLTGSPAAHCHITGAGKTTLLSALANRLTEGKATGQVLVDGVPRDSSYFSQHFAFVPQSSVLLSSLTPRESVGFVASMRCPQELQRQRTEAVLQQLGLLECADTRVGDELVRGVSGGQKRVSARLLATSHGAGLQRTSIALELVTNPRFLFLDEPTSGLDSETSLSVMRAVKSLTGRTQAQHGDSPQREGQPHGEFAVTFVHLTLTPLQSSNNSLPVSLLSARFISQVPRCYCSWLRYSPDACSQIFELFDFLVLLSRGKVGAFNALHSAFLTACHLLTVYCDRAQVGVSYFASLGHVCPPMTNPTEFFRELRQLKFCELRFQWMFSLSTICLSTRKRQWCCLLLLLTYTQN